MLLTAKSPATRRSKFFWLGIWLLCSFIFIALKVSTVSAAPLPRSNKFPDPAHASAGQSMYMTVGFGAFNSDLTGVAMLFPAPGTYTMTVHEATFCNADAYYGGNEAPDLPNDDNGYVNGGYGTGFLVINALPGTLSPNPGDWKAGFGVGYNRDCINRDRTFTFDVTPADYRPQLGTSANKYIAFFAARSGGKNPNQNAGANENSFSIEVNGGAEIVPHTNFMNLSNRTRDPAGSRTSELYIEFALPCGSGPVDASPSTFDLDTGSAIQPAGDLQIQIERFNRVTDASAGIILPKQQLTGANGVWQDVPGGPFHFEPNYWYRATVYGLYYRNAITYSVGIDPNVISELFANDKCTGGSYPPTGYIDGCELTATNTTRIFGWAYDNDAASNDPYPSVIVNAGSQTQSAPSSIWNYRAAAVQQYINLRPAYGNAVFDGAYGWSVEFSGLTTGGSYSVSGTALDTGGSSNAPLGVNPNTGPLDPGGPVINGFAGNLIPNVCLAAPPPAKDALCSAFSFSDVTLEVGQSFGFTAVMKNTGTDTWTNPNVFSGGASDYSLGTTIWDGAQGPNGLHNYILKANNPDDYGGNGDVSNLPDSVTDAIHFSNNEWRVVGGPGMSVAPGAPATFVSGNVFRAPSTPGTYLFEWRMVKDNPAPDAGWFGQVCSRSINVAPASALPTCNVTYATDSAEAGNTISFTITLGTGSPAGYTTDVDVTNSGGLPIANTHFASVAVAAGATVTLAPQTTVTTPNGPGSWTITVTLADYPEIPCTTTLQTYNNPYLRVYGNDVLAGSGFADAAGTCGAVNTGANVKAFIHDSAYGGAAGAFSGAGGQLAVTALNQITGFRSSSLRSGTPSLLSFANTTGVSVAAPSVNFGGAFNGQICAADYFDKHDGPSQTPKIAPADIDISSYVLPANGQVYMGPSASISVNAAGTIANSRRVALFVEGNVFINDDIMYANAGSGWTSTAQIPNVFIIATGNIVIDKDVTQLDGTYVAGGTIYTCGKSDFSLYSADPLPAKDLYTQCSNRLTINGAFIAKQVHFLRTIDSLRSSRVSSTEYPAAGTANCTASSASAPVCAAEVFNFSPEMYLSSPAITGVKNSNSGAYDSLTSLPPVF